MRARHILSGRPRPADVLFAEAARVQLALDQIEANDYECLVAIAKLALKRGEYGYAFFED